MYSNHYLGRQGVMESLIKYNADVNARNKYNYTALTTAAEYGNFQIENCKIDQNVGYGIIKQISIYSGHEGVVKLLLGNGADINAKTNSNDTALMLAADRGNSQIEISKIDQNLHRLICYLEYVLIYSISIHPGYQGIVEWLLKNAANVNAKNKDNNTALISATEKGSFQIANRPKLCVGN